MNPGNPSLFPWLHQLALNFQQYTMNGMFFVYISESPDAVAAVGSLGYVGWAAEYDPYAPDISSKNDALNRFWSGMTKPSRNYASFVECRNDTRNLDVLYVWESPLGANGPVSNYDLGNYFVFGGGQPAGTTEIGQLYVVYDVTLLKPRLPPTLDEYSEQLAVSWQTPAPTVDAAELFTVFPASGDTIYWQSTNPTGISFSADGYSVVIPRRTTDRYYFMRWCANQAIVDAAGTQYIGQMNVVDPVGSAEYVKQFLQPTASGSSASFVQPYQFNYTSNTVNAISQVDRDCVIKVLAGTGDATLTFDPMSINVGTEGGPVVSFVLLEIYAPYAGEHVPPALENRKDLLVEKTDDIDWERVRSAISMKTFK
jgi:hypothetical protein